MNNVAMYFLDNGYSQHETFWMLVRLIETILPTDYYFDMMVVMALVAVLNDLIRHQFPEMSKTLEETGLRLEIFAVEWFVTLFTKDISPILSRIVIELIMIDGVSALVRSALSFLKIMWQSLQNDKKLYMDQFQLLDIIRKSAISFADIEKFRNVYEDVYINQYLLQHLMSSYL
jgi:hypothetical protein